eukprot:57143-Pleurochrysis_carterae.AAC.1
MSLRSVYSDNRAQRLPSFPSSLRFLACVAYEYAMRSGRQPAHAIHIVPCGFNNHRLGKSYVHNGSHSSSHRSPTA